MQAIKTKYYGATNTRGARIKATCDAGSVTVSWDYALGTGENHDSACKALKKKIQLQNEKRYSNYTCANDPWIGQMIGGSLPNNEGYAFVFVGDWK